MSDFEWTLKNIKNKQIKIYELKIVMKMSLMNILHQLVPKQTIINKPKTLEIIYKMYRKPSEKKTGCKQKLKIEEINNNQLQFIKITLGSNYTLKKYALG
jgi:hypothetical protein